MEPSVWLLLDGGSQGWFHFKLSEITESAQDGNPIFSVDFTFSISVQSFQTFRIFRFFVQFVVISIYSSIFCCITSVYISLWFYEDINNLKSVELKYINALKVVPTHYLGWKTRNGSFSGEDWQKISEKVVGFQLNRILQNEKKILAGCAIESSLFESLCEFRW